MKFIDDSIRWRTNRKANSCCCYYFWELLKRENSKHLLHWTQKCFLVTLYNKFFIFTHLSCPWHDYYHRWFLKMFKITGEWEKYRHLKLNGAFQVYTFAIIALLFRPQHFSHIHFRSTKNFVGKIEIEIEKRKTFAVDQYIFKLMLSLT